MLKAIRQHAFALSVLSGIGLLVLAAYIPKWWLILPGWMVLIICISVRVGEVSENNPYLSAFYLMGIPVLFYFGLWESAFKRLLELIFEPSWHHLVNLLTNRSFLILVILYFAAACLFFSKEVNEQRASIERYKEHCQRLIDEAKAAKLSGTPSI